jgi:hypothetical protein
MTCEAGSSRLNDASAPAAPRVVVTNIVWPPGVTMRRKGDASRIECKASTMAERVS